VGALRRFGLLKADPDVVAVHRLVQQVIRDRLSPERRRQLVAVALRLLQAAFPNAHTDPNAWPAYAQLLPHGLAAISHAQALELDLERVAWLLTDAGEYLWQRADHPQARTLYERALAIREAHLGPDHPSPRPVSTTSLSSCATRVTSRAPAPCTNAPSPSTSRAWDPTTPTPSAAAKGWLRW
jgi:hypothetical protein